MGSVVVVAAAAAAVVSIDRAAGDRGREVRV